ncbi:hypothetical protein QYF36_001750 [Acer negundo]|nr:hypothetical protein QYF36_001750 [Acer negundo]
MEICATTTSIPAGDMHQLACSRPSLPSCRSSSDNYRSEGNVFRSNISNKALAPHSKLTKLLSLIEFLGGISMPVAGVRFVIFVFTNGRTLHKFSFHDLSIAQEELNIYGA